MSNGPDPSPLAAPAGERVVLLSPDQLEALAALEAALRDGGIVNIVGSFGSGKTTVAREFVGQARARGDEIVTLDLGNREAEPASVLARLAQSCSARRALVIDNWGLPGIPEEDLHELQRAVHRLAFAGPGNAVVILSQRPGRELEQPARELLGSRIWASAHVYLLTQSHRTRLVGQKAAAVGAGAVGAIVGTALLLPGVGTVVGALVGGSVAALLALRKMSAPSIGKEPLVGRGDRRLSAQLLDPSARARVADAIVGILLDGREISEEVRGLLASGWTLETDDASRTRAPDWMRALVGSHGTHPEREERAVIVADVDGALIALAWEEFLRDLVIREPCLTQELEEVGFALDPRRPTLPVFLERTGVQPVPFIVGLLRPSDLRRLFPAVDHDRGKAAALEQAVARWHRGEDA